MIKKIILAIILLLICLGVKSKEPPPVDLGLGCLTVPNHPVIHYQDPMEVDPYDE